MKKLGLYLLLIGLITACQKEDDITLGIGYENLYVIEDDPNDPVQHKRFELYQTYGVPIFFNDTIGKVFVKTDVNGEPVYHYELLDLNWTFNDNNSSSVTYQVTRMTDPDMQMKALNFAEIYLENSMPVLYPYAIWLTEKCYELSSSGVVQKAMINRYRNLMFSWIENLDESKMLETAIAYQKEVVKLKVQNYNSQLNAFNKQTDERYYDKAWIEFYPDEIAAGDGYTTNTCFYALTEEWVQDMTYRNDLKKYGNTLNPNFPGGKWTDEQVDEYFDYVRGLAGALGFVGYNLDGNKFRFTPVNVEQDLELYLEQMLKYPRKEFLKHWESSPLVIKKYEILYAIIKDELGIEL